MVPLITGCDVLVHEMSYGPLITDLQRNYLHQDVYNWKQVQHSALQDPKNVERWNKIKASAQLWEHSDAEMVGNFASTVGAKKLVLTHFSSRYDTNPRSEDRMEYLIRGQVQEWFKGRIEVARDGKTIVVCFVSWNGKLGVRVFPDFESTRPLRSLLTSKQDPCATQRVGNKQTTLWLSRLGSSDDSS